MYIKDTSKYDKKIYDIHPGELYISKKDEMIETLLGSCVALCLTDEKKAISGMNHYLLPGRISKSDIFQDRAAASGVKAVRLLLDGMIKKGAKKKNLTAKIFGGGHVMKTDYKGFTTPADNVRIARIMMELEDIPIISTDVGGDYTRKILLVVRTGKTYVKKTTREMVVEQIAKNEKEYANKILKG